MQWCAGQPQDSLSGQWHWDSESKEDPTAHFFGSVDQDFEFDNYWTATLSVDGHPTVFKLDMGVSVSIISSSEPWLQRQQLQPSIFFFFLNA